MKKIRRLSIDIGDKVIRSLENPTHQDSQPFSRSTSQTSTVRSVPSTVSSVGREKTVEDESIDPTAIDPAEIVTKFEKISPSESPKPNDMHLNNSFEHSVEQDEGEHDDWNEPGMKGQIF